MYENTQWISKVVLYTCTSSQIDFQLLTDGLVAVTMSTLTPPCELLHIYTTGTLQGDGSIYTQPFLYDASHVECTTLGTEQGECCTVKRCTEYQMIQK